MRFGGQVYNSRMKLATLVTEVRRRTEVDDPRPLTPEAAVTVLVGLAALPGPEARAIRNILVALTRSDRELAVGQPEIDTLSSLALGAFDRLLEGIIDGTCNDRTLRDLVRPAVVRQVQ